MYPDFTTTLVTDAAGVLFYGERTAIDLCCERYGLTPKQIAEAISARNLNRELPEIKGCYSIFQRMFENAKIPDEAREAMDFVKVGRGCDIHVSTNAEPSWVWKALKNNGLFYILSVLGRDDGRKETHLQKIVNAWGKNYTDIIVVGDNPHDFLGNLDNDGIQIIKVAVNVAPGRVEEFQNVGVNIIEPGPLTVQVMKNAFKKVK